MKTKEYFKFEVAKTVLSIFVLLVLAQIMVGRGVDVELVWNIVFLMAGADIIAVLAQYLYFSSK